jgi:hypothetical protein
VFLQGQTGSDGTVPPAAVSSGWGCRSRTLQSVQPVTSGRRVRQVPYTWSPLRPRGLVLERLVTVIRNQRAVTGSGSGMSTLPPLPESVPDTAVQGLSSREVSMTKATAQLDRISCPVVLSRGLPVGDSLNGGSSEVASNTGRTEETSHNAWRSTVIHWGSPSAARQPLTWTPRTARSSTANSAGIGA